MTTARNRTEPLVNRRLGFEAAPNNCAFILLKKLDKSMHLHLILMLVQGTLQSLNAHALDLSHFTCKSISMQLLTNKH